MSIHVKDIDDTQAKLGEGVLTDVVVHTEGYLSLPEFVENFGDGSDGDVTLSSNTTLSGNKNYTNLTINSGVTLDLNGYTINVQNVLTNNGTIINNSGGYAASGGSGGKGGDVSSPEDNYLQYGGSGGSGGSGGKHGASITLKINTLENNGLISTSGKNGNNGNNGGAGDYYEYTTDTGGISDWAAGGGGGGAGGNGGNGGNVDLYYAKLNPEGTIDTSGGAGGSGGSGGNGPNLIHSTPGCDGWLGANCWDNEQAGTNGGGDGGYSMADDSSAENGGAGTNGTSGTSGSINTTQMGLFPASGNRVSPQIDLSPINIVESSSISWQSTLNGQSIIIETRVSADGGSTWTTWATCVNGSPVPNLPTDVSNGLLECRQTLNSDELNAPELESLEIILNSSSIHSENVDISLTESRNTQFSMSVYKSLGIILEESVSIEGSSKTTTNLPLQIVGTQSIGILSIPRTASLVLEVNDYIHQHSVLIEDVTSLDINEYQESVYGISTDNFINIDPVNLSGVEASINRSQTLMLQILESHILNSLISRTETLQPTVTSDEPNILALPATSGVIALALQDVNSGKNIVGYRTETYDLSVLGEITTSFISWSATLNGQRIDIYAALSTDGGITWGEYQNCMNDAVIPGVENIDDTSNIRLRVQQKLTSYDSVTSPIITRMTISVNSATERAVAQLGADLTKSNTANDTSYVYGVPSDQVVGDIASLSDEKLDAIVNGKTVIVGGYLNTEFLEASSILTEKLEVAAAGDLTKIDGGKIYAGSQIQVGGLSNTDPRARLSNGDLVFERYLAGEYKEFTSVKNVVAGAGEANTTIYIPGYWENAPSIFVFPKSTGLYDPSADTQAQELNIYATNIEEHSDNLYRFKAVSELNLRSSSGVVDVSRGSTRDSTTQNQWIDLFNIGDETTPNNVDQVTFDVSMSTWGPSSISSIKTRMRAYFYSDGTLLGQWEHYFGVTDKITHAYKTISFSVPAGAHVLSVEFYGYSYYNNSVYYSGTFRGYSWSTSSQVLNADGTITYLAIL